MICHVWLLFITSCSSMNVGQGWGGSFICQYSSLCSHISLNSVQLSWQCQVQTSLVYQQQELTTHKIDILRKRKHSVETSESYFTIVLLQVKKKVCRGYKFFFTLLLLLWFLLQLILSEYNVWCLMPCDYYIQPGQNDLIFESLSSITLLITYNAKVLNMNNLKTLSRLLREGVIFNINSRL